MTPKTPGVRPDTPNAVRVSLPAVLLLLTVASGVVDAVSYLRFGHVFVSNMTGNVVFLGFSAAGAHGLSPSRSVVALACFLLGSFFVGRAVSPLRGHAPRLLLACVVCEVVLAAAVLAVTAAAGVNDATIWTAIVLLSLGMGAQNAVARKVAIPDLTTTVVTLTLTGIASELLEDVAGGKAAPRLVRRIGAVIAMLAGAFFGALLSLRVGTAAAIALLVVIFGVAAVLARPHAAVEPSR